MNLGLSTAQISSIWVRFRAVCYPDGMAYEGNLSHPDDLCNLVLEDGSSGLLTANTVCQPDDFAPGGISSGLMDNAHTMPFV